MLAPQLYTRKIIESLVFESMQRVLWYVQTYEKLFAQKQLENFGEQKKKELTEKRRELDKAKRRIREIDDKFQKLYEDNVREALFKCALLSDCLFCCADFYEQQWADLHHFPCVAAFVWICRLFCISVPRK